MSGSISPVVVVAGHVTHDHYGSDVVAGGCAYYAARTHRGLGAEVRLVTTVGGDFACDGALADLAVAARHAGQTTTFTNDYEPGGRRVQRSDAAAPPVHSADLPAVWRRCDVLHLTPVMGEIDLASWLGAVDARIVGINVQGWIKHAVAGEVVQRPWQIEPRELAGVGVACVSTEDLRDQGDLLDRLVLAIPIVVLTRGRDGCDVIVRGQSRRIGIHWAREVDPTGAGDTFSAAFLFALARGAAPIEAAQLAAAAASIVVEARAGAALSRIAQAWRRAPFVPVGDER